MCNGVEKSLFCCLFLGKALCLLEVIIRYAVIHAVHKLRGGIGVFNEGMVWLGDGGGGGWRKHKNEKARKESRRKGTGRMLCSELLVIPGSSMCVQYPNIYLKSLVFLWKSGKGLNSKSGFPLGWYGKSIDEHRHLGPLRTSELFVKGPNTT